MQWMQYRNEPCNQHEQMDKTYRENSDKYEYVLCNDIKYTPIVAQPRSTIYEWHH